MSLTTFAVQLDAMTLARVRTVEASLGAVRNRPGGYSPFEVEQIFMRHYRLMGEIADRHGIEPGRLWSIDERTGHIVFGD